MNGAPLVAVHQPNFFPWLGFFDKFSRADVFILLDDAQYPRSAKGTWTNRVSVLVQGRRHWLTAPVDRSGGALPINHVRMAPGAAWKRKLLATLRHSYSRAPWFVEAWRHVEPLVANPDEMLWRYNMTGIKALAELLGLDTSKIRLASEFGVVETGTARLTALALAAGGGGYLCGDGADGYQDDGLFAREGLELRRQNFVHPFYPQSGNGEFVPGLSVLDALFNLGAEGAGELLRNRREESHE